MSTGSGTFSDVSSVPAETTSTAVLAQYFCTLDEVINDLKLRGDVEPGGLINRVKAACDVILRKAKYGFIPVTEVKKFGVSSKYCNEPLYIPPLLSLTSLVVEGTTLTTDDYRLKPLNKMWANGPYITVESDYAWGDEDDNVFTGRWGLYEEIASLGITATQSTSTTTSLVVANGSLLSPGMVLMIGAEQELVKAGKGSINSPAATAATSLLNGAVDEQDASITVDNGAEFYAGEVIQIGTEDMKILKINGHVLGVERGWNGTTAADHLTDAAIGVYRTFLVSRGVNGTTAAVHSAADVYQMMVPESVNYLCRQIASLMHMKAESGFTGVTGNNEMGQGRYYSEFPPNQIQVVLDQFNTGEV